LIKTFEWHYGTWQAFLCSKIRLDRYNLAVGPSI